MVQTKSTRAFRTISEAADELDLQPHVLRFWESKFSQIQPMKRSGGRRLYRSEDIEFLRGIKILLHREKHPIKDVQKLIRIRGSQSVIDLGRSIEKAATPKAVQDTDLIPMIKAAVPVRSVAKKPEPANSTPYNEQAQHKEQPAQISERAAPPVRPAAQPAPNPQIESTPVPAQPAPVQPAPVQPAPVQRIKSDQIMTKPALDDALSRLKKLKSRWKEFE